MLRRLLNTLALTAATWLLVTGTAFANGSTPIPTLTSPTSNQVTTSSVPVSFNLPVTALAGSVSVIFRQHLERDDL